MSKLIFGACFLANVGFITFWFWRLPELTPAQRFMAGIICGMAGCIAMLSLGAMFA